MPSLWERPIINVLSGLALLAVWAGLVFGAGNGHGLLQVLLAGGVLLVIRGVRLDDAPGAPHPDAPAPGNVPGTMPRNMK